MTPLDFEASPPPRSRGFSPAAALAILGGVTVASVAVFLGLAPLMVPAPPAAPTNDLAGLADEVLIPAPDSEPAPTATEPAASEPASPPPAEPPTVSPGGRDGRPGVRGGGRGETVAGRPPAAGSPPRPLGSDDDPLAQIDFGGGIEG